jgi:biopolymer transport protein ExbD
MNNEDLFVRPRRPRLTLDLAPLIDVVFQLLVFFMLSSSFLNPALSLTLPKASGEYRPDQPPVVVSVDDSGAIYINQEEVADDEFEKTLSLRLTEMENHTVNFRGDRTMDYERFVDLMDRARKAGASQFNIVHQPDP